jgi:hypothetical protein
VEVERQVLALFQVPHAEEAAVEAEVVAAAEVAVADPTLQPQQQQ